jgi:hypothetical protein
MNFAIKRHVKRKKPREKNKTVFRDIESLRAFSLTREAGAGLYVESGTRAYADLEGIEGNLRCFRKKLYVIHHSSHVEVLHLGDGPSLS